MRYTVYRDAARQAANVAGALFQVGVTAYASTRIQEVAGGGPPSPVEPALYAFSVWALIFALSLAYAAYAALPKNRGNPLLRRVGWYTAGAFFLTGLWSVFVPQQLLLPAQLALLGVFGFLLAAYLRLARHVRAHGSSAGERWLVALPLGPFLGWVTAANAVSLASEAVRFGIVASGGAGEVLLGSALLLLGGTLAAAVVLRGRRGGPPQAWLAYGATVLWALVGIVVAQYDASPVATGAALVAAVPVVLALFRGRLTRGGRPWRRGMGAAPRRQRGKAVGK